MAPRVAFPRGRVEGSRRHRLRPPSLSLRTLLPLLGLFSAAGGLLGCGNEGEITELEIRSTVGLTMEGLQPLGDGLNYQAWLVAGTPPQYWGSPVVLFDVDSLGNLRDPESDSILSGPFPAFLDPADAVAIGISLEASDTLRTYSSYTFLLGGDVAGGAAELSPDHWIALGEAFLQAEGRFVLTTPTTETTDDELSGLWFMDPSQEPTTQGLSVPEAPAGWNYEGWLSLQDTAISMGKFLLPNAPDSAATFVGPLTPPSFPGEDFVAAPPPGLTFPTDLSGAQTFVTLEPWQEWDVRRDSPFFLRVLEGQIPGDATSGTVYSMISRLDQFPRGTAVIQGL